MKLLEISTNAVFTNINNPKRKTVTDLTLKFPVNSNRFKKYLFVLYDYNSNSILVRPTNARTGKKFIRFFKDRHENLLTRGINPVYMGLDK